MTADSPLPAPFPARPPAVPPLAIRPIDATPGWFATLLHGLVEHGWPTRAMLGGRDAFPIAPQGTDSITRVVNVPRLLVMLDGQQHYVVSHRGRPVEHHYLRGEGLFWSANAWQVEHWQSPSYFFGLVFRPDHLRILVADHAGGGLPQPMSTPYFHHCALPLLDAGDRVLRLLDDLSQSAPDSPAGVDLFRALLKLADEHLQADLERPGELSKGLRTWRRVQTYLEDHYSQGIDRNVVARSLGLHPNYLSSLTQHHAGQPFKQVLNGIRLRAAQRLLRDTDLKLGRIAELCGYGSTSYFITAFRRQVGVQPTRYRLAAPDDADTSVVGNPGDVLQ